MACGAHPLRGQPWLCRFFEFSASKEVQIGLIQPFFSPRTGPPMRSVDGPDLGRRGVSCFAEPLCMLQEVPDRSASPSAQPRSRRARP